MNAAPGSSGQWVTPREFDLVNGRIDSLETKVDDVAKDVKVLVAAHNRDEGASLERTLVLGAQRDKGARKIAWASLLAAVLGAFWWVSDAVAKLTH